MCVVDVCPQPYITLLYNFIKCGPIVTKLDMEVAGYDTCIVGKYHRNRSNELFDAMTNFLTSWLVFDVITYF